MKSDRYSTSSFNNMFLNLDMFARAGPQFRLRGREKIPTFCGSLATTVIISILAMYALIKLEQLLSRSNPNITSFFEENVLPEDYKVMLDDKNFRFAWAFESHHGEIELKNDPRFVKI